MAKGPLGSVISHHWHRVFSADRPNTGPRTLCNACGLVYAKLVRQNVSIVVPYHLQTFVDDYRSKNGSVMPHAAQLIHRMRMTVHQQTMQVLRRAATRTSRRRKSFVWRTSMWAVADGQLASPQLRLFSDDHSSTLTLSISHLGELRLQYGLSISAFLVRPLRGLWV